MRRRPRASSQLTRAHVQNLREPVFLRALPGGAHKSSPNARSRDRLRLTVPAIANWKGKYRDWRILQKKEFGNKLTLPASPKASREIKRSPEPKDSSRFSGDWGLLFIAKLWVSLTGGAPCAGWGDLPIVVAVDRPVSSRPPSLFWGKPLSFLCFRERYLWRFESLLYIKLRIWDLIGFGDSSTVSHWGRFSGWGGVLLSCWLSFKPRASRSSQTASISFRFCASRRKRDWEGVESMRLVDERQ